jgi:hydroxypyruvate reductase
MRQRLLDLYRAVCDRLDAGRLAVAALGEVPENARILGLGKVAHRQVRAVLDARPDLKPLLSISTSEGPESWAIEGDHPIPDVLSFQAGERLLETVAQHDGEPLLFLLSGGGSALAEAAREGIEPWDVAEATAVLLKSGLDIRQINTVRKRLSLIKGGGLAKQAPRSAWHVLVMSDVVGDDLGTISGGPCAPDLSRPGEARLLCHRAGIWERLPERVVRLLERDESPLSLDGISIETKLLAGSRSLSFAAESLSEWPTTTLAPIEDSVENLAKRYAVWMRDRIGSGPALLIGAGEPTLRVTGSGRGGRAQHLALLMAAELRGLDAWFLAAGTDGRDGPTEQAGAIVDGTTAEVAGDRLPQAIAQFDSERFHVELGTAIPRWDPATHLGELHLLFVR